MQSTQTPLMGLLYDPDRQQDPTEHTPIAKGFVTPDKAVRLLDRLHDDLDMLAFELAAEIALFYQPELDALDEFTLSIAETFRSITDRFEKLFADFGTLRRFVEAHPLDDQMMLFIAQLDLVSDYFFEKDYRLWRLFPAESFPKLETLSVGQLSQLFKLEQYNEQ